MQRSATGGRGFGVCRLRVTAIERSLGLIHQTDEEEDAAIGRAIEEALAERENVADDRSRAEFEEIMRKWREEELAG